MLIQSFNEMGILAKLSLLIAVVPAIMAAGYAIWPTESKLSLMRPLSLAGIFSGLTGFVVGVINGIVGALRMGGPAGDALLTPAFLYGFTESLVPLFISFGSLTLAWLLVAVGMRRQGPE